MTINTTYFSIEGLSGVGKSTLISRLMELFPSFSYYPTQQDLEEFKQFVLNENINLSPLKNASSQNKKFLKFLEREKKKSKQIASILNHTSLLSDRDYLTCFSSSYTHAVIEKTGNESYILETSLEVKELLLRPHKRIYLKASPETAFSRKEKRGRESPKLDGSRQKLLDYLSIQAEFMDYFLANYEPDNTIILDAESSDSVIFQKTIPLIGEPEI